MVRTRRSAGPVDVEVERARGLWKSGMWVRWSLRDLRARWLQVAAIALVAALGSGAYAGLNSASTWRRLSYDAGYATSGAHDLKVTLSTGATVPAADLHAVTGAVVHPDWIEAVTAELVVPTQVDASAGDEQILVPGRIVGMELRDGTPDVDRFTVRAGEGLASPRRSGTQPVAVLDYHFAAYHELAGTGTLRISGDQALPYVGQVLQPDYFMVVNEQGSFHAQAGFAVLFTSLDDAQTLSGKAGQANQLAVRLRPGVDRAAAAEEMRSAIEHALPDAAALVTPLDEERAYRLLYDDIDGDQRFFNVFALMIMAGAAFAAFNLASRVIEAQRREIGVGMALGVPPRWLAVRPLLLGLEIALLGAVFGAAVGLGVGALMTAVLTGFFPMPEWLTPFQFGIFARGAGIGTVLVFVATAVPVVRAVRVPPIDAIKVGLRETKPSGWAGLVLRVPVPGGSLAQMPLRNALRNPRRSLLTALGIAAAIATLVGVVGTLDSFSATVDRGEREILSTSPGRLIVGVDGFQLSGSALRAAVGAVPGVARVEEGLRVGGTLSGAGNEFEVVLDLIDTTGGLWRPSIVDGAYPGEQAGLVLSEKAADDLGVGPGGTVHMHHPYREGLGYRWVDSDVVVAGIHPNPYRFSAFMDLRHATLMNLAGIVNFYTVEPGPDVDRDAVIRSLFHVDGVSSVLPISTITETVRETIGSVADILDIVQGVSLLLAVLIAFNSSTISADERAREHATMFAFGVRLRTVLGMAVAESAIVGALATALGIVIGRVVLAWIVHRLLPGTMPDLTITEAVTGPTYVLAVTLGTGAVALAPLLTARKLRRMVVPDTLRIVE